MRASVSGVWSAARRRRRQGGRNTTITVTGDLIAYETGATIAGYRLTAAVLVPDKSVVRNLRLRQTGAGLTAPTPPPGYAFANLLFADAGGSVTNVRLTGHDVATAGYIQIGVHALGASATPLRLTGVQADTLRFGAIVYTQPDVPAELESIVTDFTATRVNTGLAVTSNLPLTVTGARITAAAPGIAAAVTAEVTLTDNEITVTAPADVAFAPGVGVSLFRPGQVTITGNTLTATRVATAKFSGIGFTVDNGGATTGTVTGHTISGFLSEDEASCGINRTGNAALTIAPNTFPDPPGNDTDVCA